MSSRRPRVGSRSACPASSSTTSAARSLFERICELPEYYPTRTELEILHEHAGDMARARSDRARVLVELGSGAAVKTRLLLDALDRARDIYVPVDISTATLLDSARALGARYPSLDVRPLAADYTRDLSLPALRCRARATGQRVLPRLDDRQLRADRGLGVLATRAARRRGSERAY